jgi:hypothetical protein
VDHSGLYHGGGIGGEDHSGLYHGGYIGWWIDSWDMEKRYLDHSDHSGLYHVGGIGGPFRALPWSLHRLVDRFLGSLKV